MKIIVLLSVAYLSFAGVSWAQCSGQCPPCFTNETETSGHGTSHQRTLLYVFIDNTLSTPPGSGTTNTNIYNGVVDAINKWNNTADANSCYGRPYINFWFQLN